MAATATHHVNRRSLYPPFPHGTRRAVFALGCFWGAERCYWRSSCAHVTAVGYAGGGVQNPTYEQVCTGATGHAEAVLVAYRGGAAAYWELLRIFWQAHDPTQGMRQGNDVGSQYRSVIFCEDERQIQMARRSLALYQEALDAAGHGRITTEIRAAREFFYAEEHHQQYLSKNPGGYCGLGGVGVAFDAAYVEVEAA